MADPNFFTPAGHLWEIKERENLSFCYFLSHDLVQTKAILLFSHTVHVRGSKLQNYFAKIPEDNVEWTIEPQHADHTPQAVQGLMGDIL